MALYDCDVVAGAVAVYGDGNDAGDAEYGASPLNEVHADSVAEYTIADVAAAAAVMPLNGAHDDDSAAAAVAAVEDVDREHGCDNVYVDYFVTFCKHEVQQQFIQTYIYIRTLTQTIIKENQRKTNNKPAN